MEISQKLSKVFSKTDPARRYAKKMEDKGYKVSMRSLGSMTKDVMGGVLVTVFRKK